MREVGSGLALGLAAMACGVGADDEVCHTGTERCVLAHDFSGAVLAPGFEDTDRCVTWTLANPEELWVQSLTLENQGGYHHSIWFHVPDHLYAVADGAHACTDLGFDTVNEIADLATIAVAGGVLYAQSTQSRAETQAFAEGVAIRVAPYSRILAETHVFNPGDREVSSDLRLSLTSIPRAEVAVELVPIAFDYRDLHVTGHARSAFLATCDVAGLYQEIVGAPLRLDLHYVLPHYHEQGTRLTLALAGGPRDGEELFRKDGFSAEPIGRLFDPPLALGDSGLAGFRFGCQYDNPGDAELTYGFAEGEMCSLLGFADTDMTFGGLVDLGHGAFVGDEGGVLVHEGTCDVTGFFWGRDKPGGTR
jgi:hypothetical protein